MAAVPVPAPESISQRLSRFASEIELEKIPPRARLRAMHLMLDAIGCAFAATTQSFAARLAGSVARLAGPGPRGVIGMPHRLPLRDAAMANGMLMHGLDYDDTHAAGVVHLTVSTLPAGLGLAAQRGASGAGLLLAWIAGVEAGARIAAAAKGGFHQAGFHPTGLVGTFAAALVAGRLMGLSAARLAGAQGIALSLASGNLQFIEDGAWTKRIHPGWAAAAGITAAAMAADDIPAPAEAYEGRFGLFRSHLPPKALEQCDFSLMTAGLGSTWELENVAVKPFPACHLLHACADAAIALHRAGVDPARVRSVRARVPGGVVPAVCEPLSAKRRPKSDYDAKFSIPYAVASGLARGRLGLAEFAPEALVEPRIERLMDKVDYEVDPGADFPRYYGGEVLVTLDDGSTLEERVPINRGNPERPLANGEIEAKFFDNCGLTMNEDAARRIRDQVLGLDRLSNVMQLEDALSSPETQ